MGLSFATDHRYGISICTPVQSDRETNRRQKYMQCNQNTFKKFAKITKSMKIFQKTGFLNKMKQLTSFETVSLKPMQVVINRTLRDDIKLQNVTKPKHSPKINLKNCSNRVYKTQQRDIRTHAFPPAS